MLAPVLAAAVAATQVGAPRVDPEVASLSELARALAQPGAELAWQVRAALRLGALAEDEAPAPVLEAARRARPLALVAPIFAALAADQEGRLGRADDARRIARDAGFLAGVAVAPVAAEAPLPPPGSAWRVLPPSATDGLVVPASRASAPPDGDVAIQVCVELGARRKVALRVGTASRYGLLVDGAEVLAGGVERAVAPDQDAVGLDLPRGTHRLVLRARGGAAAYLRLSTPDGAPLVLPADATCARARAARAAPRKVPVSRLEESVQDPVVRALLEVRRGGEEALGAALSRLEGVRGPRASLARAELLAEPAAKRAELEAVVDLAATADTRRHAATAALRLAPLEVRARRAERGLALLALAQARWPEESAIAISHAELLAELGAPVRAAAALAVATHADRQMRLAAARIRLLERLGRNDAALELASAALKIAPGDSEVVRTLARLLRTRGEAARAVDLLDRLAALRPDLVSARLEAAEQVAASGRRDEAIVRYEAVARELPEDARAPERLGRLFADLGRGADAVRWIREALARKPQSPELRTLLGELQADDADDLPRRYGRDGKALVAAARRGAALARLGHEPAVVLYDLRAVRVHRNGLSDVFGQRLVRINDLRRAASELRYGIRYAPSEQVVDVRVARIHRTDGSVSEATDRDERSLSEPWAGRYYDARAEIVVFSGVEPGDVIEVQYVLSDVASENQLGGAFGDVAFLAEEIPRLESEYLVESPAGKPVFANQPSREVTGRGRVTVERRDEAVGDRRVLRMVARDVPAVPLEPGMPGFVEVAPYVHVSTVPSWAAVGQVYKGLLEPQLVADGDLRRAVREAIRGADGELDRIRALQAWVGRRTRYVGLEFGIHGYKPYKATQVFQRKFGDCKDKASLLVVMLREAGIPAHLVLLRTRRLGMLEPAPASLAAFDHAIVYVPRHDLWIDGTAEFAGLGELPAMDQGAMALVMDPAGARLVTTPVQAAARNRFDRHATLEVLPGGAGRVRERIVVRGESASEWRERYENEQSRRERYQEWWAGMHPGARVLEVAISGAREEAPVATAVVEVARAARAEGRALVVQPGLRDSELARAYARLSTRAHDLVLGYPWRWEDELVVVPPPGFAVAALPEGGTVADPRFGEARLAVRRDGERAILETSLEVRRERVPVADYPAFRRFLLEVDALLSRGVRLEPRSAR